MGLFDLSAGDAAGHRLFAGGSAGDPGEKRTAQEGTHRALSPRKVPNRDYERRSRRKQIPCEYAGFLHRFVRP